ncbi:HlyC/CorC family transporter [Candidatus Peregrinibacteria bacterium]|nr:HlyC/CorC family transporter [Candidatus Peregrinibacteria bacterium]
MNTKIFFFSFLIFLSAFFSAAETALVAVSPSKVRELIAKKRRGALSLGNLKKHPQKFLITILVGSNVVNTLASVYATVIFTELFEDRGAGIAFGLVTFLTLVFGEIAPKTFAHKYHASFSLFIARFLLFLEIIFYPIIWFLERLVTFLMKISGDKKSFSMTEDELKAMISLGAEEGSLEKQEKELIENILEFNDIQVVEVMTPRVDIKALEADATVFEAAKYFREHHHSRIPVYKGDIDTIIGILSVKELLNQFAKKNLNATLESLELLPALDVPTTRKINQLFKDFQKKHIHMAIVIDEHGAVAGLATLEDLLEEIVGEIEDEYDVEEDLITKIDAKTFLIKGKTPIHDVFEAVGLEFEGVPDYKPFSFFILEKLKRFPTTGEKFSINGFQFVVTKMGRKKIELVEVIKK